MWRLTVLTLTSSLLQGHKGLVQQGEALRAAADALNADRITTLRFVTSGANFTVGQNFTRNDPWPRVAINATPAMITEISAQSVLGRLGDAGLEPSQPTDSTATPYAESF
jgi:hypothetical protein